jgi:hypothetical protein
MICTVTWTTLAGGLNPGENVLSLYKYFGSAVTRLAPSQMKDVLITFCLGDSVPDTELPVPDDATNVNKSLDSRRFNRAFGGILAHPGLRLFGHTPTFGSDLCTC